MFIKKSRIAGPTAPVAPPLRSAVHVAVRIMSQAEAKLQECKASSVPTSSYTPCLTHPHRQLVTQRPSPPTPTRRIPPTHFLAVRVTSPQVQETISKVKFGSLQKDQAQRTWQQGRTTVSRLQPLSCRSLDPEPEVHHRLCAFMRSGLQVHSALTRHAPGLAPALESPLKAHITLGVMRLEGQQDIAGKDG